MFPILFLLMYGTVVYSYVFVVQQALHYAAQEAAEAAVKVDPKVAGADALRTSNARAAAVRALDWMPVGQRGRVVGNSGELVQVALCTAGSANCAPDSDAVTVTLRFEMFQPSPLFPVLSIFMVGSVPPLPERLVASATARV